MVTKNNFNFLQQEVKKLEKLRESYNNMINEYENNIFPSSIENYYKYKISFINSQKINNKEIGFCNEVEINKQLYSIEKSKLFLGNYYDIIFHFFVLLRKEEKITVNILNNISQEYHEILINYISLLFFDNVFQIDENDVKPETLFMNVLDILIEEELDKLISGDNYKPNNFSEFLNDTLASKMIKNFIKFEDVQNYIRNIFSEIILDILEMDNKNVFIEPNRIRDYLFPVKKISEYMENDNELDKFIKRKNMRLTLINKGKKKEKLEKLPKSNTFMRSTFNAKKLKEINGDGKNSLNKSEPNISSAEFDKSFRESIVLKNYSTNVFFNENDVTNLLYNGLTHSRLIYSLKEQKIFFNNNEDSEVNIYKPINLDEFIYIKDKNPEINYDYSKYEFSPKELHYRYANSGKYNKYMKLFYYNQYKQLKNDKDKSYSNMSFLQSIKNSYQNIEAILKQYKLNFEKLKYFIDKMIYKILQNKDNKIPFCIKNVIRTINNYFEKCEMKINKIEINGYIFEFFIGRIIIPFLTNEEIINLILGKKIDKDTKSFLFYFSKIIKKIFRCNFYDSLDKNFTVFNIYLCEIVPYINLISLNFRAQDNKNNIKKSNKEENNSFCRLVKHESLIINETIIKLILEYLIQNKDNSKIKKLFESNSDLNNYFNLINENYKDIIQQFEENKENKEDNISSNIFGSPILILIKQEFLNENNDNKLSLSTANEINNDEEILLKIKYSILKFLELIPSSYFFQNYQLIKYRTKIKIFEDIKSIFMKKYMNDYLINKDKEKEENLISFIWYIDYFIKYYNKLPEEYILNDFDKLFSEIKSEIQKEIFKYQSDLSKYNFDNIIKNNIDERKDSIKISFIFYSQNRFSYIINDFLFNNFKSAIEIYIYEKEGRQYLYFNKLTNNDLEMNYIKNEIFYNLHIFIDFFSQHIIQENIITDYEEIEKKYKKKLSLIDNVNNFFDNFIMMLKEYILKEIYPKKEENGGKNSIEEETIKIEKEEIEKIISIIEKLINEEIYNRIWKNQRSKEEEELNNLYENKLSKKTPNDIGILPKYINEEIWKNIIDLIKTKYNINNFKTPLDKIECIENAYKILNKSLIIITGKLSDYSVDDIFPIFVFILMQAKIQNLITNLNFIKLLMRKKNLIKSSGFALTQLEMAIQYLRNMD